MSTVRLVATPCMDIKVGGTVGPFAITGGVSLTSEALWVSDYSALWGTPSTRGLPTRIVGQPGVVMAGKNLPDQRLATLTVRATGTPAGGGTHTNQQLVDNTDILAGLFDNPDGTIVEWVLPDGSSRWLRVWLTVGAPISLPDGQFRETSFLLTSPWPYWRSDEQQTATVNGAAVAVAVGGTATRIYDPTLLFSGNGTFTDDTSGLSVVVAGAAAPVTVGRDVATGRWYATEGGVPVPNKVTVSDNSWVWLTRGGTFTSTVSVDVTWRDQWV